MERKLITDGFNDLGRLRRSTAQKEASRTEVINATTVSLIIIKKNPHLNIRPQQIVTCLFFVFVRLFVCCCCSCLPVFRPKKKRKEKNLFILHLTLTVCFKPNFLLQNNKVFMLSYLNITFTSYTDRMFQAKLSFIEQ